MPVQRANSLVLCAVVGFACFACSEPETATLGSPRADAGQDSATTDSAALDAPLESNRDEAGGAALPEWLSETGLYADILARTLAPGVEQYRVRYELWADGAEKQRYFLLPPGEKIDTTDMDNWTFPIGTKAWKEFRKDGKLVETRLLEKFWDDPDDGWLRVAYVWNDAESDAQAMPLGIHDARGTTHDVPPAEDCKLCHFGVEDDLIGVSAIQLSAGGSGSLGNFSSKGPRKNNGTHWADSFVADGMWNRQQRIRTENESAPSEISGILHSCSLLPVSHSK